jgi:hypothetical protein
LAADELTESWLSDLEKPPSVMGVVVHDTASEIEDVHRTTFAPEDAIDRMSAAEP